MTHSQYFNLNLENLRTTERLVQSASLNGFESLLKENHASKIFIVKHGSEKADGFYTLAIDAKSVVYKVRMGGHIQTYRWDTDTRQNDSAHTVRILKIYKTALKDLSTQAATVVAQQG